MNFLPPILPYIRGANMKKLLFGIILLLVSFVLKVILIVFVLRLLGIEVGGWLGKVFDFFGLFISGLSVPFQN